MGLSIPTIPAGSGAFAVLDIESILSRLPAEVRARVVWAKVPIQAALLRMRQEPLTEDLVCSAAREAFGPLVVIARAFRESFARNREQWRVALAVDLERDGESLKRFVADAHARDTADWIFGLLRSYYDLVLTIATPDLMSSVPEETLASIVDDPDIQPLLAGQIALLGAIDAAKANVDVERARDLLDVAFLQLNKARATLRRLGFWLGPFPDETQDQRGARAIRYAERIREVVPHGDEGLPVARLRDLR